MVNNSEILRILREATLSEAKPIGLAKTDKIIGQSKGENDAYYKDVKKKMSDYEKASTSSMEGAIEEPKFNYENNDEVEYHEDMEILNGMEMLNYERKPSEKFTQRAKEAIEGSSNMGNNPEWANVYPEQKGFTGPDFGKKLVDRIERSKKKRDAATPTFDQFGDDIEAKNVGVNKSKSAYKPAVSKKPVAIGESVIKEADKKTFTIKYWLYLKDDEKEEFEAKIEAETAEEAMAKFKQTERGKSARKPRIVENVPPRPIVRTEPNPTEPQQTMKRPIVRTEPNPTGPQQTMKRPIVRTEPNPTGPQQTMKRPIVRQQDNPITESEVDPRNTHFLVEKESGKILHGYDYTDEGPEYAKDAIKDMAKDDIRDMGRNPRDIKVMTKQGLIKQGIDPMDTKNWVESASVDMGENYNKNTNESKMKRLKFKKSFNGVETALKVIPETYKVNNKVFEMTDGNEHYRVRWEGSLNEGKAVVLSSFHQESLNEDVAKIKHLMGFKSQDTLGNLKGGQRLTEDKTFFEMLKKTKALNEAKAKPDFLDLDGDGDKKEPMKQAAKDATSTKKKGIQEYAPDYDNPYDDHSPLPEEWEFILYNGKEIDTNDKYLLDTILDTIGLTFYDSNGLYEPLTTSLGETISVDDTHPEIQKLQPRLLAIANKVNTGVAPDAKDTKLVDAILDKYYTYVDKWEPKEEDEFDWEAYDEEKRLGLS